MTSTTAVDSGGHVLDATFDDFAWRRIDCNPEPYVRRILVNTYDEHLAHRRTTARFSATGMPTQGSASGSLAHAFYQRVDRLTGAPRGTGSGRPGS